MKRVFLLIVVPALLVAMGFAQTPAASGNTDQINIQGCLGGSDGNYNIAEDNTGKIFKITTSSADLKAYLGQDVKLIGHKAGPAENSLAVTELNMISEHCAAAAAAPAAAVSAPAETISTPPAAAAAPAATAPAATASAPAETVSTPAAAATPAAAPDATLSMSSETVSTPPDIVIERPTPSCCLPQLHPRPPVRLRRLPAHPLPRPLFTERGRQHDLRNRQQRPLRRLQQLSLPLHLPRSRLLALRAFAAFGAADAPAPAAPAAPAPTPASSRSTLMIGAIVVVVLLIGAVVLFTTDREDASLRSRRAVRIFLLRIKQVPTWATETRREDVKLPNLRAG